MSEAKSLRAFGFEVLVVVVGVLLALGAQELVDDWSWQRKVKRGERLLADEALRNLGTSIEFYVTAPCMAAQMQRVRDHLMDRDGGAPSLAATTDDFGRFAVRTPLRPLYRSTWASLVDDGTLAHMGPDRFGHYAGFYETAEKLSGIAIIADDQAQDLLVLTRPVAIDFTMRGALAAKLEKLDQSIAFGRIVAIRNIVAFKALKMSADAARIERFLAQAPTVVACRAGGLPLADWRKASDERISSLSL